MIKTVEDVRPILEKQGYELFGKHGAVKSCHYTKQSIRGADICYKQQFYGIQSHRCIQMTPSVDLCNYNCLFCWRPMDFAPGYEIPQEGADEPNFLVEQSIKAHIKQLIGFKGNRSADRKKVKETFEPKHVAISLSGEPTLYPRLGELIEEYHKKGMTTFLVTNGSNPEAIEKLIKNNQEPTQLYISISAPNKELYLKIDRPMIKNGWGKLQKSLELMRKLKCRTVIRLTLTKTALIEPENYAEMIKKAMPMFIECKGYMHVGYSQLRLSEKEMPEHAEIIEFSKKIAVLTGYELKDDKEESRVVLLVRPNIKETKL